MALPLIGALTAAPIFATALKFFVGYTIVRVVTALGLAVVTFGSISFLANTIESHVTGAVSGLGGQFGAIASALGLFQALNIITSAYVGAVAVRSVLGAYNRITFGATA